MYSHRSLAAMLMVDLSPDILFANQEYEIAYSVQKSAVMKYGLFSRDLYSIFYICPYMSAPFFLR